MNTMQKQKLTKKKLFVTVLVAVILLGIIATIFIFNNSNLKKVIGIKVDVPIFAFNEQVADGWWATGNSNAQATVTDDYAGDTPIDKLPIASRNIFQKQPGTTDGCFVMYSYYNYPADIDALRKERESGFDKQSDLIYNALGTQLLAIDSPEGTKPYEVYQYAVTGPGSKQMQRGMSWGYVQLSNGYIAVNGVCPEGDQLNGTSSAMRSISLIK